MGLGSEANYLKREMEKNLEDDVVSIVLGTYIVGCCGGALGYVINLILESFVWQPKVPTDGMPFYPCKVGIIVVCAVFCSMLCLGFALGEHLRKAWVTWVIPVVSISICVIILFASGYMENQANKYEPQKPSYFNELSTMAHDVIVLRQVEKDEDEEEYEYTVKVVEEMEKKLYLKEQREEQEKAQEEEQNEEAYRKSLEEEEDYILH